MKVHILNMGKRAYFGRNRDVFEAVNVYFDPERRYAVIELFPNELFVAGKVVGIEDDMLTVEYVNYYRGDNDVPMLQQYSVDWSCLKYGFCKLDLFAPDLSEDFSGGFSGTVARFYFDWELYKRCYEAINGVPCKKKDPNKR